MRRWNDVEYEMSASYIEVDAHFVIVRIDWFESASQCLSITSCSVWSFSYKLLISVIGKVDNVASLSELKQVLFNVFKIIL
jgi:hypothetical protein